MPAILSIAGRVQDARAVFDGVDGLVAALRAGDGPTQTLETVAGYLTTRAVGAPDLVVERALAAIQC